MELIKSDQSQALGKNFDCYNIDQLVEQINIIQTVMSKVMKENEHFSVLPGTTRPVLLKAGAEKLAFTFRLIPELEKMERDVLSDGHITYRFTIKLVHQKSQESWGFGIGTCSTKEAKYLNKFYYEITDIPIPPRYWELRKDNPKEASKLIGDGIPKKTDAGEWMIAKKKQKNPIDFENTVAKMAKKRALVDAVITSTAATDIFTQDEDMIDPPQKAQKQNESTNQKQEQPAQNKANNVVINNSSFSDGKKALLTKIAALLKQKGETIENLRKLLIHTGEIQSSLYELEEGEIQAISNNIDTILKEMGSTVEDDPEWSAYE